MTETTGAQLHKARAFLRWSIADLAQHADIGLSTLQAIEAVDGPPVISEEIDPDPAAPNGGARRQVLRPSARRFLPRLASRFRTG